MADRDQIIAYISTLVTLAAVFIASLVAACLHPGIIGQLGAFGLGTITGGLIGVLRVPAQRTAPATATTTTGDVNVDQTTPPAPIPPATI